MTKSLQAKFVLLLLLPVSLILISAGTFGFLYSRNKMLEQWNEASILKLQRVAHNVDMRLSKPLELLEILYSMSNSMDSGLSQKIILDRLESLEGVEKVEIILEKTEKASMSMPNQHMMKDMSEMMHSHHAIFSKITSPSFDTNIGKDTIALVSSLLNTSEETVGSLNVVLSFEYLMGNIQEFGWWQSDMACLVDRYGDYILHTNDKMKGRKKLGETNDPIERVLIEMLKTNSYGTIKDNYHPPKRVAGFYSLARAPWTIVLFAPGEKVFEPIIKARNAFIFGSFIIIVVIVLLIRFHVGKMVSIIKKLAENSINVARGNYEKPIDVKSKDEIGQLVKSYNKMVEGLRERDFIRDTFGRYVDPDFAKELMTSPEKGMLGGQNKEVVVMMTDIRNFTALSETLKPESVIYILNRYFSHMIDVIQKNRGIIVDFVGDGILLFFEPLNETLSDCVQRSLKCAYEMQNKMALFNLETKQSGLPEFEIGIGVNAGIVVVGNIGTETRAKYGIVGSEVNLTQRIQDQAKDGEIVISDGISKLVGKTLNITNSFTKKLKGVKNPVTLHVINDSNII